MNRIRNKQSKNVLWPVAAFFAVSILASGPFAEVAVAGDGEGIAGYSVRLKNKDFDGSDGGSGAQSGISIAINTRQDDVPIQSSRRESGALGLQWFHFATWSWFFRLITFR